MRLEGRRRRQAFGPGRNLTFDIWTGPAAEGGGLGHGPINYSDANQADFLPVQVKGLVLLLTSC
jgi:hypothetical protein